VSAREGLRDALREERWGDAVGLWIEHTGIAVDVYPRRTGFGGGHRAGRSSRSSSNPFSLPDVPSLRTTVTELATGLGMTGHASLDEALDARPESMVSLAPEHWSLLERANRGGAHRLDFFTAFSNGQAFLRADNGLRNRLPISIEWKGSQRAPGDEVAPIDLRVDHVYLVSCKYLSTILVNASPGTSSTTCCGAARPTKRRLVRRRRARRVRLALRRRPSWRR